MLHKTLGHRLTKLCTSLTILLCALHLTGCKTMESMQNNQGRMVGGLIGGVAGGAGGSQIGKGSGKTVATVVGALLGVFLGSELGSYLDETDKKMMETSTEKAIVEAPTGTVVPWKNPDNQHKGQVVINKTYVKKIRTNQQVIEQPCREFTQTVFIGGKKQEAYGRACRQADGSWKIVSM